MKSTSSTRSSTRSIANPRRTTLAHIQDADELTTQAVAEAAQGDESGLPAQTANPRRTVLVDDPSA